MAAAAEQIPSPPTYRFRPTKRELVKFYLLPGARGQDPFPGVIFEDDAAGSTLPWDLFERHGVGSEDEAYFIVRASEAKKPGARQDRGCDGGVGIWKMQSSLEKCLRVRGKRIRVHVSNLNLHMGKGKDSGSVGWVMHEYTIAAPPCPSPVKICHVAFSGHGRKRMRVPDGQEVCQSSGHARVGATASDLPCSGAMLDHCSSGVAYASGDEESSHLVLTDDDTFRQSPLLDSSDLQCFPSAASEQYPEFPLLDSSDLQCFPSAASEQYPEFPLLDSSDLQCFPSAASEQYPEFPLLDSCDLQCFPSAASEQYRELEAQVTMPVARQLSAGELGFWSSIGVDVESNNSFDQEQSTEVQSWVAPNTDAMATGVQSSYVVPSIGAMATGVQNSWVVPSNSAMATGVQSSWVVPNTGAMATGVQSSWVMPNTGAMAGDLDDFCRSLLAKVPTNCAVPDFGNMATRTLGGGCSLICK
ncbi:unnamed protein product [Miscanthus lutarioriparius]|uniref:NAC domain-containing protein n=1 Tax=Miscanthus lutarioriparius TaxID=422564 RepID=A0A811PVI9_9POAL|nr:unnamed protein product [Miscanthus lutarioriparius]